MSEANKTAMRQFFQRVYNEGDVAFLDQLTALNFVSHDRGNPTHDREGIKQIVRAIKSAFPDVQFRADDVLAEGDRVSPWRERSGASSWVCRRRTSRSLSQASTSCGSRTARRSSTGTSGAAWNCCSSSVSCNPLMVENGSPMVSPGHLFRRGQCCTYYLNPRRLTRA